MHKKSSASALLFLLHKYVVSCDDSTTQQVEVPMSFLVKWCDIYDGKWGSYRFSAVGSRL